MIGNSNCCIIRKDAAGKELANFLNNFKLCKEYRKNKKFYCSLKLFDSLYYAKREKILLLDSDILFFKEPTEILDLLEKKKAFFNIDYQDVYSMNVSAVKDAFDIDLFPMVNAGLIGLHKEFCIGKIPFFEEFFQEIQKSSEVRYVNQHEQTLNAILLPMLNASRLSQDYQISSQEISEKTVSHHFVADGS